jgi:hypothetical protein
MSTAALLSPAPSRPVRETRTQAAWLVPALVFGTALAAAGYQYAAFLGEHRSLWDAGVHDRNAHYLYALRLATDVRQGHLLPLLEHLNQASVWPPLHGVLAAGVLLVGGLDYRLAVLPSLAGWAAAVLLAFLVARRAAARGGTVAGLVAALFLLSSPSHRAYATDIMLESLGACLSLLAVYCYLVTVQAPATARWPGRCLGLALTALFLHKYNYWLLVLLALLAAEVLARPGFCWRTVRDAVRGADWRRWAAAQARHPLTWVLVLLLLACAAIAANGDRPVTVGGRSVSLYPPHNFLHAAYVVLFLRLVSWWRGGGRDWVGRLDRRVGQVVLWHLWPAAVWLLLPKHPSNFIWYLSLANADPTQKFALAPGLTEYGRWAAEEYHAGTWGALLAAALCGAGLLAGRTLRPGGRAVLLLFVLAAVLTEAHPNRKARNLHSWLAAGWVTAGLGAAALACGRRTERFPRARPWLAAGALAGVGCLTLPALGRPAHAPEGGPHPDRPSLLAPVDYYLAQLDESRRATILTTVPVKPLTQWTALQRYGRLDRLEENWYGFAGAGRDNRQGFAHWLRTTDCDTLIFLDQLGPAAPGWQDLPECATAAEVRDLLPAQQEFRLVMERAFPENGCRAQVWKRVPPSAQVVAPAPDRGP